MTALESMRVLDMTQWEAGPSCAQQLAWLGADVVKIEPVEGEVSRRAWGGGTASQYFLNYNGNKRSLAVDLKSERGRNLLLALVPKFDVLIENQGPGVVERLHLAPEDLCPLNRGLIYARIKGFGVDGPYAEFKCFDPLAQASGGILSVTGAQHGPPVRPGATFGDTGTGTQAALAITAAYVQQQRTGEGQVIELSMQEVMTLFMRTAACQNWDEEGPPAGRRSMETGAPSGLFKCKGDGPNDYAFIQTASRAMWEALCRAMGQPELITDPRFANGRARAENNEVLREVIEAWMAQHDKFQVMTILGSAGVPCSAVYDSVDMFRDPHHRARDFWVTLDHPVKGRYKAMRSPARMSGSFVAPGVAPRIGEHAREILGRELGFESRDIDELLADGIIAIEAE